MLRLLAVLISLALLGAPLWLTQGPVHEQLAVLALTRTDPLPRTRELVAQERYAEAAQYLDYFMAYGYVRGDPAAQHLAREIATRRESLAYQAGKAAEGVWSGQSDEAVGQAAGVISDFLVIGDLRDLARQGWLYAQGEETDPVLIALASLGVAATAVQAGGAAAAAPSGGATAPAVAAAATAKSGLSALKWLRRANALPGWLGEMLMRAAARLRQQRRLSEMAHELAGLKGTLADVSALAATPGGARLLAATTDAASLSRAARLARAHGARAAVLQDITGAPLAESLALTERMGPAAVQRAATYGRQGLRALNEMGAARFAKYSARAAKVAYKGQALRLAARWLATLPAWLPSLAGAAALLLCWLTRPRRRASKTEANLAGEKAVLRTFP